MVCALTVYKKAFRTCRVKVEMSYRKFVFDIFLSNIQPGSHQEQNPQREWEVHSKTGEINVGYTIKH